MAKPIAQLFYVNEPVGGVEGVVLTKVELFFKEVSSVYGVELQIRTTDNGFPTSYRLPDATKVLQVTDTHPNSAPVIVASDDASIPTIFEFDTPIMLQSQTSYALVIIPIGGNPDYKIWSAELSAKDVLTNTPIFTNNETGDLFLASNDRTFTPIITEDLKFNIYVANFTATSGRAVFDISDLEGFSIYSQTRPFIRNEQIYMTEQEYHLAKLTITSNTGAFTNGEVIFQSNGTANVATGLIYNSNSSVIKITDSTGSWSNAYQVSGVTSLANAVVSLVNEDVASYSNTTVDVPFTDLFYANQTIYIGTNDRYTMNVNKVISVINASSISLQNNVEFTDSSSLIGKVRGDGGTLTGRYRGAPEESSAFLRSFRSITGSTANSSVNFANSTGCMIIGYDSRASAYVQTTVNFPYNAIVPNYSFVQPQSTGLNWSFKGTERYSYIDDSAEITLTPGIETELTDKTRVIMSRSSEFVNRGGDKTTKIYADFSTSNNRISPIIGNYKRNVTLTKNRTLAESELSGYMLTLSDFNNYKFIDGKNVTQDNGSYSVKGSIYYSNSSVMYVTTTSKTPFVTGNTVTLSGNASVNAVVTSVTRFAEIYNDTTHPYGSRYISKSVILADQQDAEDLRCYIAAYRPANTNLVVYSTIVNNQDPAAIKEKYWSRMLETPESSLLLSSGTNKEDFVELVYEFPRSVEVFANSVSCNTTSANVIVATTSGINRFDYVYLYDEVNNKFIVRQVSEVANNTTLVLDKLPSFASSNCRFGTIPGIEDATGAFVFPDNNYIVRYVSNSDVVYDGFKTFNIKIVLTSDVDYLVPRAADMRCLALQV